MKRKDMIKTPALKIEKIVSFTFAYLENAQNVSQALEIGGYFVKIDKSNGHYEVIVYKQI